MKLVQTTDYLLLIDEEVEIKEGTKWVYDNDKPSITPLLGNTNIVKEGISKGWFNKIIAYYPLTKEAKELDLPLLPPFEEIDVERLAFERYPVSPQKRRVFVEGYEAAQQSDKQFSLEDIKKAIDRAYCIGYSDKKINEHCHLGIKREEEIIQSLSTQQLPKEFIPEYEEGFWKNINIKKTITNSEGKEELVGTYIY